MTTRKQQPMLMHSELTDSFYVVTRYQDDGNGNFTALEKYDVTQDFLRLCFEYTKTHTITPKARGEESVA